MSKKPFVSLVPGVGVKFCFNDRDAVLVRFMRTKRVKDGALNGLPPGLGMYSPRYVEDVAQLMTEVELSRGGVVLGMDEDAAMWLNFDVVGESYLGLRRPYAIKVAAGKVNATSGYPWSNHLTTALNDYMELPNQPWLDGFKTGTASVVRQFVAAKLGKGVTVEEQVTRVAEFGGLQLIVYSIKDSYWNKMCLEHKALLDAKRSFNGVRSMSFTGNMPSGSLEMACSASGACAASASASMGMGAGGQILQEIKAPKLPLEAWDMDSFARVFVHLKAVSGADKVLFEDKSLSVPQQSYPFDNGGMMSETQWTPAAKKVATTPLQKLKTQPLLINESFATESPVVLVGHVHGELVESGHPLSNVETVDTLKASQNKSSEGSW